MKRLWKALIMSSQPNSIIVGELDPRRCWKEAYGHYLDGNLAQLKDSLYIFALRHICFENVSPIIFLLCLFVDVSLTDYSLQPNSILPFKGSADSLLQPRAILTIF